VEALKLGRKNRLLIWLGRIWVGLSGAFSVWETVMYSGAAAFFGEWEYDKIGSSSPALPSLLMIAFLSLPLLITAGLKRGTAKIDSADQAPLTMSLGRLRFGCAMVLLSRR